MRRWSATLLVLSACAGGGQSQPTTAPASVPPSTVSATTTSTVPGTTAPTTLVDYDRVLPSGFDLVAARVTAADGTTCDLCLWLADSGDLRSRGLMFVTDLGPADGMAFVYPGPTTTRFWMGNTPLPLSIAFFGVDGAFVDSFDMPTCSADDSNDCPRYPTPADFVVAVETYQGGLSAIDMIEGSTLELLDLPCQP